MSRGRASERVADDASKTTYYKRKREIVELQSEISSLQARLQTLLEPQLLRESELLQQSLMVNRELVSHLQECRTVLASFESIATSTKHVASSPLSKSERLEDAKQYIEYRCHSADLTRRCKETSYFDAPNGDRVASVWQVAPVEEAQSVRELFDAVLYFEQTEELGISEKLGAITVREDHGDHEESPSQVKLVLTFPHGLQVEWNHACFSQFHERTATSTPYGIIHMNHVEEDALYPYQPESRIRQDVTGIVLVTQVCRAEHGEPPLPVVVVWGQVRIHKSDRTHPRDLDCMCQEEIALWGDTMLRCVQERALHVLRSGCQIKHGVDSNIPER